MKRKTTTNGILGSLLMMLLATIMFSGCLSVKTQHEIKPIHITMDINLKVDKELDDFFGDLDEAYEEGAVK